jgi:hypothetical protein
VRDLEGLLESYERLKGGEENDYVVKPDPKRDLAQARADYTKSDRDLNAQYKGVVGAIDAPARKLLAQSELKWIALRDLDSPGLGRDRVPAGACRRPDPTRPGGLDPAARRRSARLARRVGRTSLGAPAHRACSQAA